MAYKSNYKNNNDISNLSNIAKTLKSKKDIDILQSLIDRAVSIMLNDKMNTFTKNVEISNIYNVAKLLEQKSKMQLDNIKIDNNKVEQDEIKPLKVNIIQSQSTTQKDRIKQLEQSVLVENGETTNNEG